MNALTAAGFPRDSLRELVDALRGSAQASVDAFLSHRPALMEPGKAAIAAALILRENHSTLSTPSIGDDHWYQYLWYHLQDGGPSSFGRNKLGVVTFNYDRSLEWFLVQAYADSFGVSLEAAWEAVSRVIRIVHVHGDLGALPFHSAKRRSRAYEPTLSPETIAVAADSLLVLSEADDDSTEFRAAKELMRSSEQVIFLGFGFHNENLRRLGCSPSGGGGASTWMASGFDLTVRERTRVRQFWGITAGEPEWTTRQYLRERVDFTPA